MTITSIAMDDHDAYNVEWCIKYNKNKVNIMKKETQL